MSFVVKFQKAAQNFAACSFLDSKPRPRCCLIEAVFERTLVPSIGSRNHVVHLDMNFTKSLNVLRVIVFVMEVIVQVS